MSDLDKERAGFERGGIEQEALRIAGIFPEQNVNNFEWDAAIKLNDWGFCASQVLISAAARIAELEAEVARLKVDREWKPIETAPKGKIVFVHYKNSLGNGRTVRAQYYLHETLESDESESGYADEGWYEESEAYEYLMPLDHEPTHWMPLPSQPDEAMKGGA